MLLTLDKLWKSIIEDFWDDFIRYFFPELIERVDFSRLPEFLDKDLDKLVPENAADNRRADILMKVFLLDGGE